MCATTVLLEKQHTQTQSRTHAHTLMHTHTHKPHKAKNNPDPLTHTHTHTHANTHTPAGQTKNVCDAQRGDDIRICKKKDFAAGQRLLMMNPFIIK